MGLVLKRERTYDVTLQSTSASPATTVPLILAEDEQGNLRIRELRVPPLPPRQSQGPLQWTHRDPLVDFMFAQDDFSEGALQPYYRSDKPAKYARSHNVDLRWKGVAALGMQRSAGQSYFLLRNGDAELAATTGWTAGTGVTLTAQTTTVRSGTYAFQMVTDGTLAANAILMRQDLDNPTVYQSRSITVGGYLRKTAGAQGIKIRIDDGVGTSDSSNVTADAFTYASVTRTIDAAATQVRVGLLMTSLESGANTLLADDLFVFPAGGVECAGVATADNAYVTNADFEVNNTTGWSVVAGDGTVTNVTTAPHAGSRHLRVFDTDGTGTTRAEYTLLNWNNLMRDRLVTVECYARVDTAGGGVTGNIYIGDNTNFNLASTAFTTASYAKVTASAVLTNGATSARISVDINTNAVGTRGSYVDNIRVWVTPAVENRLHGAFGRVIALYDKTDTWDATYIDSAYAATDVTAFEADIYVALGRNTGYMYGHGLMWQKATAATLSNALNFTVSRNTLWRSKEYNTIQSATDPREGGSWGSSYTVGSPLTAITALHSFNDTIYVGKSDGLWKYLRVYDDGASADLFQNLTNEWATSLDDDNFALGQDWHGWLYLSTSRQGLVRFNGATFDDLSYLMMAPRLTDFGGRVRAITADPHQLWLLVDTPQTDTSTTKDTRLMSLRFIGDEPRLHTIAQVSIGLISRVAVHASALYAFGRIRNSDLADDLASIYSWTLPDKTAAPYADDTPAIETSGWFETSVWHGDMPATDKAALALTIWGRNLTANRTVRVDFGLDGAAANTTLLTTFAGTGAIQTAFFNTLATPLTSAVGKAFQLRFTLVTNDTTSPELYAFALSSTLRPDRVKAWELYALIGDETMLRNGLRNPIRKGATLSDLSTLETQDYPIVMVEDFDDDGTNTTTSCQILSIERTLESSKSPQGAEVYRIVLQEAKTSA